MPLPIIIDTSEFVRLSSFTEGEIKDFTSMLLDRLSLKFKEEWINEVNSTLKSTRQEYIKGMYTERPDENTIVMGVTARQSQLAVDLELGKSSFDMKEGFSKSSKKTITKKGNWYITVPFRHAVPGSVGESGIFSSVMPEEVYSIAKKQTKPIQLNQLSPALQIKGIRPAFNLGNRSIPAYKRKSVLYEGLVRNVDTRENRGTYTTFRRVSSKSDPSSWWHPGFPSYNFLGKALAKTDITGTVRRVKIDFFKNR